MRACRVILIACGLVAGCAEERRVISVSGGLQSISGSVGGERGESQAAAPKRSGPGENPWERIVAPMDTLREAGQPVDGRPLRRTLDDGSIHLICHTPRQLLVHLFETLRDGEMGLLEAQVLSDRLKEEYRALGRPESDVARWLLDNRKDIFETLSNLPGGEMTPGTYLETIARNTFRLTVPNARELGLRFSSLEFTIERGGFRLLLIS
ncbi:MAG: hypothetical protein IBJ11_00460 [Phycisphaerales bacterium]|nr:hypothetical protein [Phycisphaerales bacterium]